jgi:hypothetical protein
MTLEHARHVAQLVVAAEDDATVIVDDKVAGKGRFDGQLAPGHHQVKVSEPGKAPYVADVDLKDGETRTMQVTLESEHHGVGVWPWVVGGVVVAAGAAVGGYFLFKPQDQTAAPPTGKLGGVQFSAFGR